MPRRSFAHLLPVLLFLLVAACQSPGQTSSVLPANPETGEQQCGGIAGFSCGEGEYCQLAEGECHIADAMGVCKPIVMICTREYWPVCGCDGKTYGNACDAGANGASIDREGAC